MIKNNKLLDVYKKVKGFSFPVIIIMIIVGGGCKKEEVNIRASEVIPADKMINVLTDMYLADGLLNNPDIRKEYSQRDSTMNYSEAIGKHGYTKSLVDRSLEYYLIRKPKKFEMIYDMVLENLSNLETSLIQEKDSTEKSTVNYWNGDITYSLPDKGTTIPIEFSIPLEDTGLYQLSARITVFIDDQTLDPKVSVWYWYDDGTEEGYIDYWEPVLLEKDSKPHTIEISKILEDPKVTHIRGFLYGHTEQPGHWEKHGQVSSIVVSLDPLIVKE